MTVIRAVVGLAAWLPLCAGAPYARADASNVADDVQCLLALTRAIDTSADPEFKTAAQIISAYYVGRIDGRDPAFDLTAALIAQSGALPSDSLLRKRVVACAAEYTDRYRRVINAGGEMKRGAK